MLRFALVLLLIASLPLHANLGETIEQCVKRYGKPVGFSEASSKFPFGTMVFTAGTYTLVVFLDGTKEVGARVTKKDDSAFSDAELKTIMGADAIGAGWTTAPNTDPACVNWTREDKATAIYDHEKHVLIFTSDEMTRVAKGLPPATNSTPTPPAPPSAVPPTAN